jgi:hypothetical protein
MKNILFFLLLFLLPLAACAQFPNSPNKIRLGNQTTGLGLVHPSGGVPSWTPTTINNAWAAMDTTSGALYAYFAGQWNALSGSDGNGFFTVGNNNDTLRVEVAYIAPGAGFTIRDTSGLAQISLNENQAALVAGNSYVQAVKPLGYLLMQGDSLLFNTGGSFGTAGQVMTATGNGGAFWQDAQSIDSLTTSNDTLYLYTSAGTFFTVLPPPGVTASIYTDSGTVAPIADMLVRLRPANTFSIANCVGCTGFEDFYNNYTPGTSFAGTIFSPSYWGSTISLVDIVLDATQRNNTIDFFSPAISMHASSATGGAGINLFNGIESLPEKKGRVEIIGTTPTGGYQYDLPVTSGTNGQVLTKLAADSTGWRDPATATPQTLSISNDTLSISGGNSVTLNNIFTAGNGLTKTGNQFRLGGTLDANTTITGGAFTLAATGSMTGSNSVFSATNSSSGRGVTGTSTSGVGVYGSSTSGNGVEARSTSGLGATIYSGTGVAMQVQADGNIAADFRRFSSTANLPLEMIRLTSSTTTGNALPGHGGAITFYHDGEDAGFGVDLGSQISSSIVDGDLSNFTAKLQFSTKASDTIRNVLTLQGQEPAILNEYTTNSFIGTGWARLAVQADGTVVADTTTTGGGSGTWLKPEWESGNVTINSGTNSLRLNLENSISPTFSPAIRFQHDGGTDDVYATAWEMADTVNGNFLREYHEAGAYRRLSNLSQYISTEDTTGIVRLQSGLSYAQIAGGVDGHFRVTNTYGKGGRLRLTDYTNGGGYVQVASPDTTDAAWTLTLPKNPGTSGQVLQTDGAGVTTWATAGGGVTASIYTDTGTVAPIEDFLLRTRADKTFAMGECEGCEGFEDFWENYVPGSYFKGLYISNSYAGGIGISATEFYENNYYASASINTEAKDSSAVFEMRAESGVSNNNLVILELTAGSPQLTQLRISGSNNNLNFEYSFPNTSPSFVNGEVNIFSQTGTGSAATPSWIPSPDLPATNPYGGTNTIQGSIDSLYANASAGGVTGSGTTGTIPVWSGATALGDSPLTVASGNVTATGTGSFRLPNGTDAQRPGTPSAGETRYNTTNGNLEFYGAAAWEPALKSGTENGLGTAGRVFYANGNGRAVADDLLYWNAIDNRLGIGVNPATSLHVSGVIRGNNGFNDIVLQDGSGNQAFRSVRATTGWGDAVATQFFQVGANTGNAVFSAAAGTPFARVGFYATSFHITTTNSTAAPIGRFDISDGSTKLFNILADGKVGILNSAPQATLHVTGSFSRGAPVTKTGDFTVAATENWLIVNNASANTTVTLPTASTNTGRELMFKNLSGTYTVISNASNVVPIDGTSAGTAILPATAGAWATLVSDGTNWIIMQAN